MGALRIRHVARGHTNSQGEIHFDRSTTQWGCPCVHFQRDRFNCASCMAISEQRAAINLEYPVGDGTYRPKNRIITNRKSKTLNNGNTIWHTGKQDRRNKQWTNYPISAHAKPGKAPHIIKHRPTYQYQTYCQNRWVSNMSVLHTSISQCSQHQPALPKPQLPKYERRNTARNMGPHFPI